jgi:hypothetical protein
MKTPAEYIHEIVACGIRPTDIHKETGISKSVISELMSGIKTRMWSDRFSTLVDYHEKVLREDRVAKRRMVKRLQKKSTEGIEA